MRQLGPQKGPKNKVHLQNELRLQINLQGLGKSLGSTWILLGFALAQAAELYRPELD